MKLDCPYCGRRGSDEFSYLGDAAPKRPRDGGAAATEAWVEYVYLRDNPAGPIAELWYHDGGCQSWLVVERDTRTHVVSGVRLVMPRETSDA